MPRLRRDRADRRALGLVSPRRSATKPSARSRSSRGHCFGMKIILPRKEVSIAAASVCWYLRRYEHDARRPTKPSAQPPNGGKAPGLFVRLHRAGLRARPASPAAATSPPSRESGEVRSFMSTSASVGKMAGMSCHETAGTGRPCVGGRPVVPGYCVRPLPGEAAVGRMLTATAAAGTRSRRSGRRCSTPWRTGRERSGHCR